jgi:hypothetical protein
VRTVHENAATTRVPLATTHTQTGAEAHP